MEGKSAIIEFIYTHSIEDTNVGQSLVDASGQTFNLSTKRVSTVTKLIKNIIKRS